jgi:hypothetical protein
MLLTSSYSFINKNLIPIPNLLLKPNYMIDYLTSLKEYTIITVGENNRDLENLLTEKNFKVYYVNMENIIDYKELVEYLNTKYKNYNSGEDLWVFYKGFFIGSREDIYNLIKNKK